MVKINIWHDDKFQQLSDDGQLVWFHLYTNPLSNGLGLFHANIEGLAAAKKWPLERYRKGFGEGLGKRLFLYDETYQTVYFPRFLEHNKPANPNVMVSMLKAWDYIPPTPYKIHVYQELKRLGKRFAEKLETLGLTLPQTIPETVTVIDTVTDIVKNPFPLPGEDVSTEYLGEPGNSGKIGGDF